MAVPPDTDQPAPGASIPHDPDSPMSGDQADLLQSLCEEAGEPFDAGLTQRQALERIEVLRRTVNEVENL